MKSVRKVNQASLDQYRRIRAIHLKQRRFWITMGDSRKRRYMIESLLGYRAKYAPHLMTGECSAKSRAYARCL